MHITNIFSFDHTYSSNPDLFETPPEKPLKFADISDKMSIFSTLLLQQLHCNL